MMRGNDCASSFHRFLPAGIPDLFLVPSKVENFVILFVQLLLFSNNSTYIHRQVIKKQEIFDQADRKG